jgi:hypothetical protein
MYFVKEILLCTRDGMHKGGPAIFEFQSSAFYSKIFVTGYMLN